MLALAHHQLQIYTPSLLFHQQVIEVREHKKTMGELALILTQVVPQSLVVLALYINILCRHKRLDDRVAIVDGMIVMQMIELFQAVVDVAREYRQTICTNLDERIARIGNVKTVLEQAIMAVIHIINEKLSSLNNCCFSLSP